MIDIHAHILPGVDDGAETYEDGVGIVKSLVAGGVTDVIATPHYINETNYMSPRSENRKLMGELKKRLKKEGIEVNLYLGNEIYIDKNILNLIKNRKIAPLAGSKYLLVELPLNDEFDGYEDVFLELMENDYKVILAHPERYVIVQEDFEIARRLHDEGVLLQCNLASITGKYGHGAKKVLQRLAKEKMIFAFGSDMHRPGRNAFWELAMKKLGKYYNERELSQVLSINPKRILVKS